MRLRARPTRAVGGTVLDGYDESVGKRLEQSHVTLSKEGVRTLSRSLEDKGLVASIFERPDPGLHDAVVARSCDRGATRRGLFMVSDSLLSLEKFL